MEAGGGAGKGAGAREGARVGQALTQSLRNFQMFAVPNPPNFPNFSFPPSVSRVPNSFSRSLSFASRRFSTSFGAVLAFRWRRPQSAARLEHGELLRCLLPRLSSSRPSMRWSRNE